MPQRLVRTSGASETILGKTSNVEIKVVGRVEPMVVNGIKVFANGLHAAGGKVFVTYITPGLAFGGGIDLLDPSDPMNPVSAKSSAGEVIDVSSVAVNADTMWVGGSVKEGTLTGGGYVTKDNGALLLQTFVSDMEKNSRVLNLQSGDVTSLSATNGMLYATSAGAGLAYTLRRAKQLSSVSAWSAPDLRSVLPTANGVYVLSATGLHFRSTKLTGSYTRVADVPALIDRGIAKLSSDGSYLYVPLNKAGLSVVDLRTNKEVTRVEGGTFNGAAADGDFVYVANADGGVVVYEWNAERTQLTDVRRLNLDNLEANHVLAVDGYLYVALADGGVRVLKVTKG